MLPIFVLLLLTACSFGQNLGEPFTLIRLIRIPSGPNVNLEAIQGHRNAQVGVDVVGLQAITGTQQIWLLEAQGSFASLEATDRALAAAPVSPTADRMLSASSTLVGVLRPGLSYRPVDAIKALPGARYFQVTFFQTRPGASMEFAEVMRIRNAAQDQVNVDRPEIGYQIISGGESGTYVFLAPMPSLNTIDNAIARTWGNPDGHGARQATGKLAADGDITREQMLFRVEPRISYVSEAFAAAAPDFWNQK
jgi:hypothetical protein